MPRLSWTVEDASSFLSYKCEEEAEADLTVDFLLQITDSGRVEDHFRFQIAGQDDIDVGFKGRDLIVDKAFWAYTFKAQMAPDQLEFRRNCLTTAWEDLADLVDEGRLLVRMEGVDDPTTAFKEEWSAAKAGEAHQGASLRWAVLAGQDGLKLDLQALPADAHLLNRDPRLRADASPAIGLCSFALEGAFEADPPIQGPIPILFAKHPERARNSLKQGMEKFLKGESCYTVYTKLVPEQFTKNPKGTMNMYAQKPNLS